MPTYDYICSNCGKTTEIVHSINGSAPTACPACGAEGTLRKAFNPPTIHFKGSGWAKKDRSGGGTKASRSSDSTTANSGDSAKGDSGKGDSGEGSSGKGDSTDSSDGGSKADPSALAADTKAKPAAPAASGPAAD
jgi:putative FmdB family regulatory protein